MTVLQSNMDALLVAIPMVGIMCAGVFRLDELLGKPKKKPEWRRPIAGSDANGAPICIDPDGKQHARPHRRAGHRDEFRRKSAPRP